MQNSRKKWDFFNSDFKSARGAYYAEYGNGITLLYLLDISFIVAVATTERIRCCCYRTSFHHHSLCVVYHCCGLCIFTEVVKQKIRYNKSALP